ncbi:integral membrane sensor signal transduction histidine kinase [Microbacterium testaceum]|uniref:Integral membrane sensor signal transduction histidine kinase n=1 Tax=Microbacterium testaceum TaxID=2033 RepID=A0A2T7W286_MICTE|nr:integral membrane sensor signal transduction histidine kinase [Microbacterium testaceum]
MRLAAGLAAVIVAVAALAGFGAQWLAEREAVNDAAQVTNVLAEAVVRPVLSDALAAGDPAAVAAFDVAVRGQILGDDVVRVKIWSPEGRVLYADEPQLIGRTFALEEAQREALDAPATRAAVSDLSEDENVFESAPRLLEVYRPMWAPGGQQVLFEVYYPYAPVAARSAELWRGFTGVTLSSLLLLVVLTAPIVWTLLRQLRGAETRRAELLQRAVDASDAERRRIAGSLHDGPVQELVATSYGAESAAVDADRRGDVEAASRMREVAGSVRGNVRVLRSLLVDIYPESLGAAGLAPALRDLAATAHARGVTVNLDLGASLDHLSEAHERLLYRVAQETLRNAATHAAPCTVSLSIARVDGAVELQVADDGPGFDPALLHRAPSDGHLGTRVLRDLAVDAGAELSLATAPGRGTRWRLRVPAHDRTRETA